MDEVRAKIIKKLDDEHVSIAWLGRRLGVSRQYVWRMLCRETRPLNANLVERIGAALGIQLEGPRA